MNLPNPREIADAIESGTRSVERTAKTAERFPWGTTVAVVLVCMGLTVSVTVWLVNMFNGDAVQCRIELKEERTHTRDLTEKLLFTRGFADEATKTMQSADSALNDTRPQVEALLQKTK